jgi:DNA-3-methyladenine glycosylase II
MRNERLPDKPPKSSYLRALAKAIIDHQLNLDNLDDMDEEAIRKDLMAIKGIGKWTSDIYLMFCLQRKDIFPIGDIAVVNTVKELYKIESREDILAVTEKWIPFRSGIMCMWNYYLGAEIDKKVGQPCRWLFPGIASA